MSFDFKSKLDAKRDQMLRRAILECLNLARAFAPSGELSGPRLQAAACAETAADFGFESDSHFLALCLDLENLGLIRKRDLGILRRRESYSPRHVSFAITAKGTQLVEELIPPIAGIDDERITESR